MQPPTSDAQLVELLHGELPSLAELYDRFAHALDPFDETRDRAEQQFESTVSSWYDRYTSGSGLSRSSQAVIRLCKQFLKVNQPRIQVRGRPKSD
jgi:hypothetical protein